MKFLLLLFLLIEVSAVAADYSSVTSFVATVDLPGSNLVGRVPMSRLVFDTNSPRLSGMLLQLDTNTPAAAKFDYLTNLPDWMTYILPLSGKQAATIGSMFTNQFILSNTTAEVQIVGASIGSTTTIPSNSIVTPTYFRLWGDGESVLAPLSNESLIILVRMNSTVISSNYIPNVDMKGATTQFSYNSRICFQYVTNNVAVIRTTGSLQYWNSLSGNKNGFVPIIGNTSAMGITTNNTITATAQFTASPTAGDYFSVMNGGLDLP